MFKYFCGTVVLGGMALLLAPVSVGSATWILIDDFNDLNDEGWTQGDVLTTAGPRIVDANSGEFNSADFVQVFQAGKYETDLAAGWDEGDWDGNGDFDSSDFVVAFTDGGYEQGPRTDMAAVPEPAAWTLLVIGVVFWLFGPRTCAT